MEESARPSRVLKTSRGCRAGILRGGGLRIAIAIGVNAAAIVDLTDIAAENTGMRLFGGAAGSGR